MKRLMRSAEGGMRISFMFLLTFLLTVGVFAQIPQPGPAKSVKIPAVNEATLKNGLTVAVVEKHSSPVVTVQLLVKAGAGVEENEKAGLANFTADMLTKGTKTRTAEQIAEQLEFLGSSLNSGAGWNSSSVSMSVTSDKLSQAMPIMSDVILNPSFKQEELDLMRSQTLDELKSALTQPPFLASYAASAYSFSEHPAGGTPQSLASITQKDLLDFYKETYQPDNAVLIFTGDITPAKAQEIANTYFGRWKASPRKEIIAQTMASPTGVQRNAPRTSSTVTRVLVLDLPQSGQASVTYAVRTPAGRIEFGSGTKTNALNKVYYPALTLNSVLGGGYSSRLNQEIRIKRGLSYGAGSSFSWRLDAANFTTRTQTKNVSAAEVASLVLDEIKRLGDSSVTENELIPRKSVLTGNFGRNLETTSGLASAIADLYTFDIGTSELNKYVGNVTAVTDGEIKEIAKSFFTGGDLIIVGDYAVFKDDLAKRFPGMKVEVIKAADVDVTRLNSQK